MSGGRRSGERPERRRDTRPPWRSFRASALPPDRCAHNRRFSRSVPGYNADNQPVKGFLQGDGALGRRWNPQDTGGQGSANAAPEFTLRFASSARGRC